MQMRGTGWIVRRGVEIARRDSEGQRERKSKRETARKKNVHKK